MVVPFWPSGRCLPWLDDALQIKPAYDTKNLVRCVSVTYSAEDVEEIVVHGCMRISQNARDDTYQADRNF